MGAENIEGVGIGVSLFDGASTLETLRAVRAEMVAIAQLSGRGAVGGENIYGPSQRDLAQREQNYKAEENIEREHIARMARIRAEANRPIGRSDVDVLAQRKLRDAEQRSQVAARVRQIEQENAQKQAQLEERIAAEAIQRRARIEAYKQVPGFGSGPQGTQLTQQRALFQQYRNDPARDTLTNQYRQQFAEETVASREYVRDKVRLIQSQYNEELLAEKAARDKFRAEMKALRSEEDFGTLREQNIARRQLKSQLTPEYIEANSRSDVLQSLNNEPVHLNARRGSGGPTVSGYDPATSLPSNTREYAAWAAFQKSGGKGAGGSGGGPPAEEEEEGGPGGGGGGRTGRGLVGRFIAYQALYQITFELIKYTEASIQAARATIEQGNALRYATEAGNGNLEANRALASQLQIYGFNVSQSSQVVAQASRATFRHPEQTAQLAEIATNIAASRGGGLQNATKVIEDIQEGRDRTYREYFNTTPEDIYKQEARRVIGQRSSGDQLNGIYSVGQKRDYKTEEQQISAYVSKLTEEEKEQLRLNFALSQSYRFQGDAIDRLGTLAGKLDLVSAAFFNASANVGAFITDIRPVKDLLDQVAGAGPSKFGAPILAQSGPRNTITDADVINFGADSSTSSRAGALHVISKVVGAIANNITPLNSAVNAYRSGQAFVNNEQGISDTEYDRIVAENIAKTQQVKQRNILRQEGQLGFRNVVPGQGDPGRYFSYEQLRNQGVSPADINKNYVEDVRPKVDDRTQAFLDYKQKRESLESNIAADKARGYDNIDAKNKLSSLEAQRTASILAGPGEEDYRIAAQKREDERKAAEQKQKDKEIEQRASALTKLREFKQGSFRVVDETAQRITGPDNPYVKVLADQYTAAQRMHEQWGFLGKDIEAYELKLEQAALNKSINKLEFSSYTTGTNLLGQAAKETAERNGPGLSRNESSYLNIQEAIINRAREIPKLWEQAAAVLGNSTTQLTQAQQIAGRLALINQAFGVTGPRLHNLYGQDITPDGTRRNVYGQSLGGTFDIEPRRNVYGQSLEDPSNTIAFATAGVGQSKEVQRAVQKSYADNLLDVFKGLSPAEIRKSGYQDVYLGALRSQGGSLQNNVLEAREKAEYGAQEDARLKAQLAQDEQFRQSQLAKGRPADDVRTEADRLLLARTEGVNPKDLTFDQYKGRQDALRRQAQDDFNKEKEAKEATQLGIDLQAGMLEAINNLRDAIIKGDMGVTITVNNDTDARIDQNALKDATPDSRTTKALPLNTDKLGANALKRYERFGKRE